MLPRVDLGRVAFLGLNCRRNKGIPVSGSTAKAHDHFLIQKGTEDHLVFHLLHCVGAAHEPE